MKRFLTFAICAIVAFCVSAARINHGLIDSSLPSGPGLTLDEAINTGQGIYLFESFAEHGPFLFEPQTAREVFGAKGYMSDYPPLGRFLLGASHQLTSFLIDGNADAAFNIPAARLASCAAFALTCLLLSVCVSRRYGLVTGVLVSGILVFMPRVVGHSRIASLETITNLAWVAALLPLMSWWVSDRPPSVRQAAISGGLWGLLLLTKVQGILFPPMVVLWAFWQYRERSIFPLVIFGFSGLVVFFVGWPWLWLDPIENTREYFLRTTERPTLYVWYLGERFADKQVPWHYPFIMSAVTLPVSALGALLLRFAKRRLDSVDCLMVLAAVWPMLVFALPGTPVYDGTRLFLPVMPPLAVLAARGIVLCRDSRGQRALAVCVAASTVLAFPATFSPFALSDYNLLCGGPSGANAIGLETSYWGDGVNGDFWNQVPENSTVYVAPVCHQFQLSDVEQMVPVFRQRGITLKPFLYDPKAQKGLILIIHRLADVRPSLRAPPPGARLIAETRYRGVVMAQLFDTTTAEWEELPDWPGL